MSVIKLVSETILVISHENYIKDIYGHVEGKSYCFNNDLFDINEPFKTYDGKYKKKKGTEKKTNSCSILNYPYKMYTENMAVIKECLFKSCNKLKVNDDKIDITRKRQCDDTNSTVYQFPNQQALNAVNKIQQSSSCSAVKTFNGSNPFDYPIIRDFNGQTYIFPPRCTFFCMDIKNFTNEYKFDVIVMDPPWTNKAIRRKNKKQLSNGAANGYTFMSNDDIQRIPIDDWLTPDGVVLVWCTNAPAHRKAVDEFFDSWKLVKVALWYWLKVTAHAEPVIPFSSEDLYMKQPYEVLIVGARGDVASKWRTTLEGLIVSVPSAVHSHKPPLTDVIRFILEKEGLGEWEKVKCLEVFARSLVPGWTSIGNEVLKLQNVRYYEEWKETGGGNMRTMELECTPPQLQTLAEVATNNTLPTKSKEGYKAKYQANITENKCFMTR